MTVFIPTTLGVVKMDLEDRLKFPGKIVATQAERKINITIYHDKRSHHGHRLIMGCKRSDRVVDHKNGDRFDWRKKNLRVCSVVTNNKNKGDYKKKSGLPRGVRIHGEKFVASIQFNKKSYYLGTFDCKDEAHSFFVKEHKRLHGKNSVYNVRKK